jgi:molybdenum cofactor synthesis domain-containing protein
MIRTVVLTISDKSAAGKRKDKSGHLIKKMIKAINGKLVYYKIIPDENEIIKKELIFISDNDKADLILTTGGTGFAERDITPEATLEVIEKEIPGIPEKMRKDTIDITPMAALSRARAGIRNKTLIINLPGSPKAVEECLEAVIEIIPHGIDILRGNFTEHDSDR